MYWSEKQGHTDQRSQMSGPGAIEVELGSFLLILSKGAASGEVLLKRSLSGELMLQGREWSTN